MNRNRAALIGLGWMGDFIWLVPIIRELRKKFESLSLVVSEQQEGLARSLADDKGLEGKIVDNVWVDHKKNRLSNAWRVAKEARNADIGTYIDVIGKWKTGLYMPWLGKPEIFIPSPQNTKEYTLARLLHPRSGVMTPRQDFGHYVDSYLGILEFFGIREEDYGINFDLIYNQETVDKAEKIIAEYDLREQDSVVLNLSSGQYSKIWSPRRFSLLALELKRQGLNVVIMGADHFKWNNDYDRKIAEQVFDNYKGLVSIKDITLMVNAYLLSSGVFNVSVGCDSFANHMAGSSNQVSEDTEGAVASGDGKYFLAKTRTVTLMGPTNPFFCHVYDPTGTFHKVIKPKQYGFKNCYIDDCDYRGVERNCRNYAKIHTWGLSPCMMSITVEQVVPVVLERLVASKS